MWDQELLQAGGSITSEYIVSFTYVWLTRQTGLTPAQQAEMLKPGRGSLRKGFMAYIEKL
jgi:hypothetical protein